LTGDELVVRDGVAGPPQGGRRRRFYRIAFLPILWVLNACHCGLLAGCRAFVVKQEALAASIRIVGEPNDSGDAVFQHSMNNGQPAPFFVALRFSFDVTRVNQGLQVPMDRGF
jgi:hypothetical protein